MGKPKKRLPCPFCGNFVNAISGCLSTKCNCCEPCKFYCAKCGATGPAANNHLLAELYWNTRRKKPGPERTWDINDIRTNKLGRWYGVDPK